MLKDMLSISGIKIGVEAEDWQEAIEKAGQILVDNGNVTHQYINAMIDVVNEYGPYIVICPGVAFAHARPSSGAIKPGISMIVLKKPVRFGHEENDPVKIVFAFAGKDHNSHIELLAQLANLLDNKASYDGLLNAKTPAEIQEIIEKGDV